MLFVWFIVNERNKTKTLEEQKNCVQLSNNRSPTFH